MNTCEQKTKSGKGCRREAKWFRDDGLMVCGQHSVSAAGVGSWNCPMKSYVEARSANQAKEVPDG